MRQNVAILLPVYNESARLHHVRACTAAMVSIEPLLNGSLSIYFVNDGSTDNTAEGIAEIIEHFKGRVRCMEQLQLPSNTRKAGLYLSAYERVKADIYAFVDADNSFRADDVIRMIRAVSQNEFDVVIAAKQYETNPGHVRSALSALNKLFIRAFMPNGITDSQTGLKVFSATSVRKIFPQVRVHHGFAADFILLFQARKHRLRALQVAVPVQLREGSHLRIVNDSLRYLGVIVGLLWDEFTLRHLAHPVTRTLSPWVESESW